MPVMKLQRLLVALTIVNMVVLVFLLSERLLATPDAAQVLRGRSLEILDDLGRGRASIALHRPEAQRRLDLSGDRTVAADQRGRQAKHKAQRDDRRFRPAGRWRIRSGLHQFRGARRYDGFDDDRPDGRKEVITP
jgi:hypothetical protein